jgi:hypothetical protein
MPLGAARFGLLGGVADLGKLELIETQTITTTTANVDFTNLGSYNVHFLTYNNAKPDTDAVTLILRSSNDGGSTFETTNYQFAAQWGITDATFGEGKNTTANNYNSQNQVGNATNETGSGYFYLYNFLDSSKYNFVTYQSMGFNQNAKGRMAFGSAVHTVAETHNAIRLLFSSGNFENVDVSLYGIAES